ncbi:Tryptophan synthase alpha chain [Lachnospiraceae bacterium TWA4]|nr:Tryptophan synthase alpha chain [Lachnospiraceae bacterium TWA4]
MSRIQQAFCNGKAFIPFITCGDPNLDTTKQLVYTLVENGADLIELGIPFSDPTAEGPTIQEANLRALSGGVTTDKIFDLVMELRQTVEIPLVFMTYANVVYSFGTTRFVKRMEEVGMDGLILPDVPFEEKDEFASICEEHGIDFISLIAPTSENRIVKIAQNARGFIYCVSSLGVTGTRSQFSTNIDQMISNIKSVNPTIPCAIGFGISNPEQVKKMSELSDGVIVGSAIVKKIAKYKENCIPYIGEFVKEMKNAQFNQL